MGAMKFRLESMTLIVSGSYYSITKQEGENTNTWIIIQDE